MHRQTHHQSPTLRKQVSQRKNKTGENYNPTYHEHEAKKSLTTAGIAMPEWSCGLPLSVRTLEPAKYEYVPGPGCLNVGWRYPPDKSLSSG